MMTKLKLTSLILIFPLLVFGQVKNIDAGIYKVVYDEGLENPTHVTYTVQCPEGTASRKGMDFYSVDSVHTANNDDYKYNVWDKGHMAPAANFNCNRETLKKTFSYLNSALQHKGLNRGVWKSLETYERKLALTESPVEVTIEVIFTKNPERVPGGAAIPSSFIKSIKTIKRQECYYFENDTPKKSNFKEYLIQCLIPPKLN
ncbi:DNA/RNA non-specific endonuclease [bacterium]|nr:DNA/RNA non-specific endonuclease [bacterium]